MFLNHLMTKTMNFLGYLIDISFCHHFSLKTIESENQFKQIAQLKTYIGESENIPKSVEILKTENNTLKNKLNVSSKMLLHC